MNPAILTQSDYIFITDIGSTTTKALLLQKKAGSGKYFFAGQCDAYTTVEEPYENVNIGLINAARKMEKLTSVTILDDKNNFRIPYLTTSSAAGGLQMLVLALTHSDSGNAAKQAALCAGGVVHRELYFTDRISEAEKIRIMKSAYPDMILFAGGYEGGINTGVIRLAHLLNMANPVPKFMPELKIPLVYCGNSKIKSFLTDALSDSFDLNFTENVRPDRGKLNLEPAKNLIHNLFKEKVMQRAPGFLELTSRISGSILPTPTAVENILLLYTKKCTENIVVVDMGGSTTDIYTCIKGGFKRTVAANVGLSYSMANILESIIQRGGIAELKEYLPDSFDEKNIRNYFYNKTLQPSYLPQSDSEYLLEQACAILGFQFSWQQHIEMNFCQNYADYFDRDDESPVFDAVYKIWNCFRKNSNGTDKEQLFQPQDCPAFYLSEINTYIGSGGVIAYAKSKADQIMMLTDGFLPSGISRLAIDKPFKISHMGMLAEFDAEQAVDLFANECLEDLAWVIAPFGKIILDQQVLEIEFNGNREYLTGGECRYYPLGGSFNFKLEKGAFLQKQGRTFALNTDLPVLVDCRGRGKSFSKTSLLNCRIKEFTKVNAGFYSKIPLYQPEMQPLKETIVKRELPYEGEIVVKRRECVNAGTVIGLNPHFPSRHFFIDLRTIFGLDKKISNGDILDNITVQKGQLIQTGQIIWHKNYKRNGCQLSKSELADSDSFFMADGQLKTFIKSPYHGEVSYILKNGLIVLNEIREYFFQPQTFDVSKELDVPVSLAMHYCRYKVGDFVEQTDIIADYLRKRIIAGKCGFVKELNRKMGTITIHYDKKPLQTHAFVNGRIVNSDAGSRVEIACSLREIKGAIGFGGENFGTLSVFNHADSAEDYSGKVIYYSQPIDRSVLQNAARHGWKGLIAPSMCGSEWVNFYGRELGVAITGNEKISFTVIFLHGFGHNRIDETIDDFFKSHTGKMVSLNGQTQIRAGVIRPQIILS